MIDNRQNIINATERFALTQTKGLTRLTTREIAAEAKVAEGLIYHHFKDKAGLIYEVVTARFSETTKTLAEPATSGGDTHHRNSGRRPLCNLLCTL